MSTEEENKQQEEKNKKLEEEKNFRESIKKLMEEQTRYSKEHYQILSETATLLGDMEEARKNRALATEIEIGEEYRKHIEEISKSQNLTIEQKKELLALEKQLIQEVKNGEELSLTRAENAGLDVGRIKEILEAKKEQMVLDEKIRKGQDKYGKEQKKLLGDVAKSMGITEDYTDSFFGKMTSVLQGLRSGEEGALAFAENFLEIFSIQNIALSTLMGIVNNTMDVLKAFDSAQASIAKATGQGREFNDVLYDAGRAGNLFGVSMEDTADAINTMVSQTSAFTNLSKDLQTSLALDVAKMKELNVSTEDSAKIFQNFNQGLGITATESMKMQKELAMAGVEVGIGASKITRDFNASLSTLMVYGRESINVFKGIAAAAKAAGVETSTLLGIAQKFDTFAGSAEGVGKLNALLGTQLSTTEMLMATEDERIRMLVKSVQSQGVAFQDMDRFTQKAVANAAGITDMAEANRIFGMSLKEYDENERKLKASTDAQKKLDDAVASTVKLMDKMKILGAEMITALEPTFEILTAVADSMINFLKGMSAETKNAIVGVVAFTSAILVMAPLFMAGGGLVAGLVGIPAAISAAGVAAGGAAVGFGALASALAPIFGGLLAVAAIGGLAYGLGSMLGGEEEKTQGLTGDEIGAIQNLDNIMNADFSEAFSTIKAIVGEASKLGSDMKITSTIENLALITSGQSRDINGNRMTASATNITTKVENIFSGMKMTLVVDGKEIDGVIETVTEGG